MQGDGEESEVPFAVPGISMFPAHGRYRSETKISRGNSYIGEALYCLQEAWLRLSLLQLLSLAFLSSFGTCLPLPLLLLWGTPQREPWQLTGTRPVAAERKREQLLSTPRPQRLREEKPIGKTCGNCRFTCTVRHSTQRSLHTLLGFS